MNKHILLFIGILLGFLVKGQDDAICMTQHEKNLAAAQALVAEHAHLNLDNVGTFKCKTPEPKARRVRSRVRGITAFEIQPSGNSEQSSTTLYDIPVQLFVKNNALVCPFYYVFLFRLTPF